MSVSVWGEEDAQATVEMAIVLPVMIALALIAHNVMVFSSAVARFDRIAPDIVLALGVSPPGDGEHGGVAGSSRDAIERELTAGMGEYDVEVEVQVAGGDGGGSEEGGSTGRGGGAMLELVGATRSYRCIMRYRPWPHLMQFAGVNVGTPEVLTHERVVTVDPWRPGVV